MCDCVVLASWVTVGVCCTLAQSQSNVSCAWQLSLKQKRRSGEISYCGGRDDSDSDDDDDGDDADGGGSNDGCNDDDDNYVDDDDVCDDEEEDDGDGCNDDNVDDDGNDDSDYGGVTFRPARDRIY